jgi:hypothetical protein
MEGKGSNTNNNKQNHSSGKFTLCYEQLEWAFINGSSGSACNCKALSSIPTTTEKKDGHQWLMPIILATQEAEIRGIMV